MNKVIPLTLVVSILLGRPTASAQVTTDTPRITVSGSAVIRVAPDEVNLTLGIETRDKTLAATQADNQRRTTAVITMLKNAGIAATDIRTDRVSVAPQYERYDSLNIAHYAMRQTVAVKLKNLDQFSSLVASALEVGASHVDNIEFVTSEIRTHRDRARTKALKAAREKATAMAAELGVKPTKVLSITEGSTSYSPWRVSPANLMANAVQIAESGPSEPDGGLALGLISVSAEVSVSFAIE